MEPTMLRVQAPVGGNDRKSAGCRFFPSDPDKDLSTGLEEAQLTPGGGRLWRGAWATPRGGRPVMPLGAPPSRG